MTNDHGYDDDTEKSLLANIAIGGEAGLIARLDVRCFGGLDNRLVFEELRLMKESGAPLGDPHALARWFSSAACKRRWAKHERHPGLTMAEAGERYVSSAHSPYYLSCVYRDWLRRSQEWVAAEWVRRLQDGADPLEVWQEINGLLDGLHEKVAERFPKSLEATV